MNRKKYMGAKEKKIKNQRYKQIKQSIEKVIDDMYELLKEIEIDIKKDNNKD